MREDLLHVNNNASKLANKHAVPKFESFYHQAQGGGSSAGHLSGLCCVCFAGRAPLAATLTSKP